MYAGTFVCSMGRRHSVFCTVEFALLAAFLLILFLSGNKLHIKTESERDIKRFKKRSLMKLSRRAPSLLNFFYLLIR